MLFVATLAMMVSVTLTQTLPASILPIDQSTDAPVTSPWFCHNLDCPKYTVQLQTSDFEIRHYEPSVWVGTAKTNVDMSSFKTSQMFQKLFHYIDHGNSDGMKIPMTAPVVTQFVPTSAGRSNVSMFFMIPFNLQANPPAPKDADVFIKGAPEMTFYVKSYGGFNLFHQSDHKLAELKQQLGNTYPYDNTQYFTAGYDSPFSFTHRHNEVWLIAKDGSPETAIVGRRSLHE